MDKSSEQVTERREFPRPDSIIKRIEDITHQTLRKHEENK
jgi:hypothetical protein